MTEDHLDNPFNRFWNLLLGFSMLLGVGVTVLIFNREQWLGGMYANHHKHEHHGEAHSNESAHEAHTDESGHQQKIAEAPHQETEAEVAEEPKDKLQTTEETDKETGYSGDWLLVTGSFKQEKNALSQLERLKKVGYKPVLQKVELTGETYLRVIAFKSATYKEALYAQEKISEIGIPDSWILKR